MVKKALRYTFGFVILALILASIALSRKMLFCVSVVFIIFTIKEYREMFESQNIHIHKFLPEIISIILSYIVIKDMPFYVTPVCVAGIMLSFLITIIKNKKPYIKTTFSTIMAFTCTYCALYIVKLFYFYTDDKFYLIIVYFIAVMLGDYSASKIGPHFKNKLLAPEISPNKTVMGAVSNLVFSCLSCLLLVHYHKINVLDTFLLGTTISVFSQIGDLSVSIIKRDLGIKHSGSLFCDYGGILDRVDSFLFSAPAMYYCLILVTLF